jgi:hypothetical protein
LVLIAKDRHSIAVMRTDGSNVEVLTPPEQSTIHPNWSADSKRTNDDLAPPKKNSADINAIDLATKKIAPLIRRDQYLRFVVARYETYRVPQNHW